MGQYLAQHIIITQKTGLKNPAVNSNRSNRSLGTFEYYTFKMFEFETFHEFNFYYRVLSLIQTFISFYTKPIQNVK